MPSQLALPPPPLARAPRGLGVVLWEQGPALLWRLLHPLARQPFADAAPTPLARVPCTAEDGVEVQLGRMPIRPGGAGEPVVLLPTLGVGPDVFRCGSGVTLASRLQDAGFGVFLAGHRAGGSGTAVVTPAFDDAAELDVAAVVDVVREASGYPRVHLVGHGLGGQLALAWAARSGGHALASLAVLSTPVKFGPASDALAHAMGLAGWLPGGWRLPVREVARWGAVLVEPEVAGPRRRAALSHVATDVPMAMLAQVRAWLHAGALVDRRGALDYRVALGRVAAPLWVSVGDGDRLCPVAWTLPVRDAWCSGPVTVHRHDGDLDHLGVVLDADAGVGIHAPLVSWLHARRALAWREAGEPLGVG